MIFSQYRKLNYKISKNDLKKIILLQCQYVYLHQCVRDVLRARKLRGEQENPLFPIYENVNPEYHRGKCKFIKL